MGTGKSTVSAYLKQKNIPIVDADAISREVTAPGAPLLADIKILLGEEVFHKDGTMNRQAVANKIFADSNLLKAYESLVTAEVVRLCEEGINKEKEQGKSPLIVLDAPLLFETGCHLFTDEVWLVDADLRVRLERIKARDGLSEDAIMDRIRRQMSTDEKKNLSDYVIDNSGDLEHLYTQVENLLGKE